MARFQTIDISTVPLTTPNYLALERSIEALKDAEDDFYKDRRKELETYKGQGGLSTSQVENAYDSMLGRAPWDYSDVFQNSGNSEATETNTDTDEEGNDEDDFYVQLPESLASFADSGLNGDLILYKPGKGFKEVDLLFQSISFFTSKGSPQTEDDDDGNGFDYYEGFGELPVAYRGNGTLSGINAHMYRLIGDRYDSSVGPKYRDYKSELAKYEGSTGGGNFDTYKGGTPDQPYKNYQPAANSFGYNKPGTLSIKIVEEARGYN